MHTFKMLRRVRIWWENCNFILLVISITAEQPLWRLFIAICFVLVLYFVRIHFVSFHLGENNCKLKETTAIESNRIKSN